MKLNIDYNVLKYYILIKFNSNHSTCFHNIFETLLCKHIKQIYDIDMIFYTKT
jgi:hypothetical protein